MRKILIILCLLLTELNISAHDFEVNNLYYNITSLTDRTVAVAGNNNTNVVIPQNVTWNGITFTVNEITAEAFTGCTLGTLTVPPTVLYMQLRGCAITKLVIEDGKETMYASRNMQEGESCCSESYIDELYLGRNSQVRFDNAYNKYNYIKKVTFGNNVTEIAAYAFDRCYITGTLTLPKNIKKIGSYAFCENKNLEKVIAPGVEHIEAGAFGNCINLKTVDTPTLKHIGNNTFENCRSLTSFEIPQGVSTVEDRAFWNCTNLESVTIPNSICYFGNGEHNQIFNGCTALKSITVNATTPFNLVESNFDVTTYINATLHVPSESLNVYKNTANWKNFVNIVGDAPSNDNVCSVLINGCDGYTGYVEIDNVKYKQNTYDYITITKNKGENITLKFIPADSYHILTNVEVNGTDVTDNIVDNELTVKVTENLMIDVFFDTHYDDDYSLLSIKQADNGNVKLKVGNWRRYNVTFEPAEGWKIHSVSFNGTDVTNLLSSDNSYKTPEITEDSELIVVYVSDQSAIDDIHSDSSSAKVVGSSGNIMISNAEDGETVYVYTIAGVLVNTSVINNGTTTIRVQENGIYLVKIGNKTFKIGM